MQIRISLGVMLPLFNCSIVLKRESPPKVAITTEIEYVFLFVEHKLDLIVLLWYVIRIFLINNE